MMQACRAISTQVGNVSATIHALYVTPNCANILATRVQKQARAMLCHKVSKHGCASMLVHTASVDYALAQILHLQLGSHTLRAGAASGCCNVSSRASICGASILLPVRSSSCKLEKPPSLRHSTSASAAAEPSLQLNRHSFWRTVAGAMARRASTCTCCSKR